MNPTRDFVIELQQLMDSNFNEKDFKQVSRCFLDYMAATNAGVYLLNERIECMVDMFGSCGIISPIGFDTKVSLETAAFINGLTSHVAEMDDGVRFGMIHPGAPIFSALIPAAERFKVKGIDFVKGVTPSNFFSDRISVVTFSNFINNHKFIPNRYADNCVHISNVKVDSYS